MSNIASLLHEQALLKSRISKTLYGSIEIREQGNKEYIYVHFNYTLTIKNKLLRFCPINSKILIFLNEFFIAIT